MARKTKKSGFNISENNEEGMRPDCDTCVRRKGCDRAASGSFCTRWSRNPADRTGQTDPNDAWRRGDEAVF